MDRLVPVIDAVRAGDRTITPPDAVHGHFANPIVPIVVFDPPVPGSFDRNVDAAVKLDTRIGALKAQYSDDMHPLDEDAMGNYMLDRATGDLASSSEGSYVEYVFRGDRWEIVGDGAATVCR